MKIIYPNILNRHEVVSAFFTEANRAVTNHDGSIPGLNLGYNTSAGESEVSDNFYSLFSYLGWDSGAYTIARQVHGNRVETVNSPGIIEAADGLVTRKRGLAIGIRVADCAALLAADPQNHVVGAFHAGWKGAASGIVSRGIAKMASIGADPENIFVYASPCISQKNFEVGEEVAVKFPEQFIDRQNYKKPHVDLPGFILSELIKSGLNREQIKISNECTIDHSKYYSYRREREKAGRMLAMIKLNHNH